MAVKLVTDFRILMYKAKVLGDARMSGDEEAMIAAQADHDAYKTLCLQADEMALGVTFGDLY